MPPTTRRIPYPKHLIFSPPPPQHVRPISTTSLKSYILFPSQRKKTLQTPDNVSETLAQINTENTNNTKAHQPSTIPTPERQHIIQKLDEISRHLSNVEKSHSRVTDYFRRESQHSSRSPEVRNRTANFGALFDKTSAIHSELAAVQLSVLSLKTQQEILEVTADSHQVPEDINSNITSRKNPPSEKELDDMAVEQQQHQQHKSGKDVREMTFSVLQLTALVLTVAGASCLFVQTLIVCIDYFEWAYETLGGYYSRYFS